jgi:hypothetical protein
MQCHIDAINLHVGPRALVVVMIASRTVIVAARDRETKEGRKVKWQYLLLVEQSSWLAYHCILARAQIAMRTIALAQDFRSPPTPAN